MSTPTAPRPPTHHRRRRALLAVAVVTALGIGAAAAAASLASSSPAGAHPAASPVTSPSNVVDRAVTPATTTDAQAVWDQLATLTADQRDHAVAGLSPEMQSQLSFIAQAIALAAEHH